MSFFARAIWIQPVPPPPRSVKGEMGSMPEGCDGLRVIGGGSVDALPRMSAPSEDLACDYHSLNLIRSLIDLCDLCVAHHSFDWVLLDVAVSTESLHAIGGYLHRDVGCTALRDRGPVGNVGIGIIDCLRRAVDGEPGSLDLHRHVGKHELHPLERRNRLPELLALSAVLDREVERSLRDPQSLRGNRRSREVESSQRDLEALV